MRAGFKPSRFKRLQFKPSAFRLESQRSALPAQPPALQQPPLQQPLLQQPTLQQPTLKPPPLQQPRVLQTILKRSQLQQPASALQSPLATRRRLATTALALALTPTTRMARAAVRDSDSVADLPLVVRSAIAFHGIVRVTIAGLPCTDAQAVADRLLGEIRAIDSLVRPDRQDSEIARLNRSGRLDGADPRLLELIHAACRWAALTQGAFDPTVQPLWTFHAGLGATDFPVPAARLRAVVAAVDHRAIRIDDDRIRLLRRDTRLTLNGLAQGFAADRALALARSLGASRVLVDAGEFAAGLGPLPGARWRLGVNDPTVAEQRTTLSPERSVLAGSIELVDGAVASSAGAGWRFGPDGSVNHLFDPRTGRSPPELAGVTVIAPDATTADALSTAFTVMGPSKALALAAQLDGVQARLVHQDGSQLMTTGWRWSARTG